MDSVALIDSCLDGPRLLRQAVAGMSREQLLERPIPGKWSTLEVVCHLADFEIVFADRIKRVIAENEPTPVRRRSRRIRLAASPPPARSRRGASASSSRFAGRWSRILRTLQPADFQRRGMHSEAGPLTWRISCSG